jgi:deoxyadenosine/deoxycytidine kinase
MRKWFFNLQIYFLHRRYKNVSDIQKNCKSVVQDCTIYEEACIFVPKILEGNLLFFKKLLNHFKMFDLLSFISVSTSCETASLLHRRRSFEFKIIYPLHQVFASKFN